MFASLFAAQSARAGDFVDTRLNFTLTDENMLVKPGETNPSVPGVRIGQPNSLGILFFDNYDTRYTGYENLTHLVIYKKIGDGARHRRGARYVLRLLQFTDVNLSSIDDGSYIQLTYWFDRNHAAGGGKTNIALTAFPLNADRMRLGYSYRISWGGSPIFFKFNPDLPAGAAAVRHQHQPGAGRQAAALRRALLRLRRLQDLAAAQPQPAASTSRSRSTALLAGVGVDVIQEPPAHRGQRRLLRPRHQPAVLRHHRRPDRA